MLKRLLLLLIFLAQGLLSLSQAKGGGSESVFEYVYPENEKIDSRGDGSSPELGRRKPIFTDAYKAFLDVRNAVKSGDYHLGREILDELWAKYPRGNEVWKTIKVYRKRRQLPDTTDFAAKPFYVNLIFYDDIINWRLQNNVLHRKAKEQLNIVLILVKENQLTVIPEGEKTETYISKLDPAIQADDYRAIREGFSDFDEIMFYLTEGRYNIKLTIVEHPTPTTSTVRYTKGQKEVMNSWPDQRRDLSAQYSDLYDADWSFFMYPFSDEQYYPLDAAVGRLVSGGVGACLIGTVEKFLYSRTPPHPPLSSDERISWITAWLVHEYMHHVYKLYRHLNLETKPHCYFDRNTWPKDFEGFWHLDYYTESIKKRILLPGEVRFHKKVKRRK